MLLTGRGSGYQLTQVRKEAMERNKITSPVNCLQDRLRANSDADRTTIKVIDRVRVQSMKARR
jgi:hypothetical protein